MKTPYASVELAKAARNEDGESWAVQSRKNTEEGLKMFLKCSAAKENSRVQCPAKAYILLCAQKLTASLSRSEDGHQHNGLSLSN